MSERRALTRRQQEIYEFIKDKIMNRGYGPTVREIGAHFDIRSPNGVMCHLKALEKKDMIIRDERMSRAIQLTDAPQLKRTSLPLAGQIAAGTPVLAVENRDRIDFAPLFNEDSQFCLKVKGDSMIEDHIADGDFAVIRRQTTARDGDIVVALVDGQDATLKRFFKERGRFRLEPANATMQPIYSDDVEVLGVLVGVIRQY
jgi:repressor LexA